MKPILVVDNAGDFPKVENAEVLVEFERDIERPTELGASSYPVMFIHSGNRRVKNWALNHAEADAVFIFSGDMDGVAIEDGFVEVNREYYKRHFNAFLDAYVKAAGKFEDEMIHIFEQRVAPSSGSTNDESYSGHLSHAEIESTDQVISFGGNESRPSSFHFAIESESGQIDYIRTLKPLRDLEGPRLIYLRDEYCRYRDGLDLLLHLRLSARHPFSRFPVIVRSDTPIEEHIAADVKYTLLCFKGVSLVQGFPDPGEVSLSPITEDQHRGQLKRLTISPRSGRHERANEWGALRLKYGLQMMCDSDQGVNEGSQGSLQEWEAQASRTEYLRYLLALESLRVTSGNETYNSALQEARKEYERWSDFLENRTSPLSVLFIDDVGERGWNDVMQSVFSRTNARVQFTVYPGESKAEFDDYEQELPQLFDSQDLIICDLRLTHTDKRRARDPNPRVRRDYVGIQALKWLKESEPTIPFIAFTASDKMWPEAAVREYGGDGYWVKESPDEGVSTAYSLHNAALLLQLMRKAVERREEFSFLWKLVRAINSKSDSLVDKFKSIRPRPEAGDRIKKISNLLLRAYGYLDVRPTTYQQDAFGYAPRVVAFIHLWACLNHLWRLRFKNSPSGDCFMLRAGSPKKDKYWDNARESDEPWEPWFYEVYDNISHSSRSPLRPGEGSEDNQGSESAYIMCYLKDAGKDKHERNLDVLRERRNELDIIHGADYRNKSNPVDTRELKQLVEVLRFTLFDDTESSL